ncbi:hypothetical protein BOTBODRAFT_177107 [Botryobasidium botryosum FD-172 SS1]|uniref:Uncharacterized protein n=1 Tax=Botryobasidium botryosum (strain FD-172 SS1) TaxID=930990 RepID=A0A067MAJ3_BOTB1|nr:hypothetical protein BOTBODRAFT_177107 [Botryobasidium botryosum FD-172 SS1]
MTPSLVTVKYDLHRYFGPRMYMGRAELQLVIEAALASSEANGHEVKLQNIVALCIAFYTAARPSSLAAGHKTYQAQNKYMKLGDVKVTHKGPMSWEVLLVFKNLKTLDELFQDEQAILKIHPDKVDEPFFLKASPGGRKLFADPPIPATARSITSQMVYVCKSAQIGELGITYSMYCFRRDALNIFQLGLGADIARVIAGHKPGTSTIDRYYSEGPANLEIVNMRLGKSDFTHQALKAMEKKQFLSSEEEQPTAAPKKGRKGIQLGESGAKTLAANEARARTQAGLDDAWPGFLACFQTIAHGYARRQSSIGYIKARVPLADGITEEQMAQAYVLYNKANTAQARRVYDAAMHEINEAIQQLHQPSTVLESAASGMPAPATDAGASPVQQHHRPSNRGQTAPSSCTSAPQPAPTSNFTSSTGPIHASSSSSTPAQPSEPTVSHARPPYVPPAGLPTPVALPSADARGFVDEDDEDLEPVMPEVEKMMRAQSGMGVRRAPVASEEDAEEVINVNQIQFEEASLFDDSQEGEAIQVPTHVLRGALLQYIAGPAIQQMARAEMIASQGGLFCDLCTELKPNATPRAWPDQTKFNRHMEIHTEWDLLLLKMKTEDVNIYTCPAGCGKNNFKSVNTARQHCLCYCPNKAEFEALKNKHTEIQAARGKKKYKTKHKPRTIPLTMDIVLAALKEQNKTLSLVEQQGVEFITQIAYEMEHPTALSQGGDGNLSSDDGFDFDIVTDEDIDE